MRVGVLLNLWILGFEVVAIAALCLSWDREDAAAPRRPRRNTAVHEDVVPHPTPRRDEIAAGAGDLCEASAGAEHGTRYCGQVVAAATGEHVAAKLRFFAAIDCERPRGTEPAVIGELATAADGTFLVRFDAERELAASVEATGFLRTTFYLDDEHTTPQQCRVIALAQPARLRVRVVDPAGRPQVGSTVVLYGSSSALAQPGEDALWIGDLEHRGSTDSSGRCVIEGLASGSFWLRLLRDEVMLQEADDLELASGEDRALELTLRNVYGVRGQLVDERNCPLAAHPVWLLELHDRRAAADGPRRVRLERNAHWERRQQADAQGRFAFADLRAGVFAVGPEPVDDIAPMAEVIEVGPEAPLIDCTVRTARGQMIEGLVLLPSLGQCAHARIVVSSRDTADAEVVSDDRGRFRFGPVVPGEYELACAGTSTLAAAGDKDVRLVLPQGSCIEGRVGDATGCGLAHWSVRLLSAEEGIDRGAVGTTTAEDGSFHFSVPSGVYDLLARAHHDHGSGIALRRGLRVPSEALVTLTPEPGALLDLGAADTLQVAYEILASGLSITRDRLNAGWCRTEAVPAGDVTVRWTVAAHRDQQRTRSRRFSLAAGARARLVMD
ncbi:MAG: carboxypeptidase-like regulatory domain-containing protein [Planctomycetota bacterium]